MPLAALSLTADQAPARAGWLQWPVLRNPGARKVLIGVAVYEFIADKLPDTQSRLALTVQPAHVDTGLLGRVAAVALAGAALGSEHRAPGSLVVGAVFAGFGALLGNFAGYYVRQAAVDATGLPDNIIALAEDAAAIVLASAAVQDR